LSGLGQDARTRNEAPQGGSERKKRFRRGRRRRGDASKKAEGQPRSFGNRGSASVKVGRKPQEGWRSWVAPTGKADSGAIETLKHPPSSGLKMGNRRQSRTRRSAGAEGTRTRARRGRGEGLEEETWASSPWPGRKTCCRVTKVRGNPKSAAGMKYALQGSRRRKPSRACETLRTECAGGR
jgi:hypothetical protein